MASRRVILWEGDWGMVIWGCDAVTGCFGREAIMMGIGLKSISFGWGR